MKKVLLVTLSILYVSLLTGQNFKDISKLLELENYDKAKLELLKSIKNPEAPAEAFFYLGNVYLFTEDNDSAMYYYNKAVNHPDGNAYSTLSKGRIALMSKNPAEAKTQFDKAIKSTKSKNVQVFYEIGNAYLNPLSDVNKAIENFESAYTIDPKNTTVLLGLGDAYAAKKGDPLALGSALTKYESAVKIDNTLGLAKLKIARINSSARIYDEAVKNYEESIKLDPTCAICYKELAESYYLSKQFDKVGAMYKKYVDMSPEDKTARSKYAGFLYTQKEYDKAIEEAQKGIKEDPNNPAYYNVIAYSALEKKDYKLGAEYAKKFFAIPNNKIKRKDHIVAGKLANEVGDTTAVIYHFDTALKSDSTDCELLSEYAKILFGAQKYNESITQYKRKERLCEKLTVTEIYYVGRIHYSTQNYAAADSVFTKMMERAPSSAEGPLWKARTLKKNETNGGESAMSYYDKFITLAETDKVKYSKGLIEAYEYLAVKAINKDAPTPEDITLAKSYASKIIELDPANEAANELLKIQ